MRKSFIARMILFITFLVISTTSYSYATEISSKEFLSSDFVKFLKNKEYTKALEESEALLKKHPDDNLILRYRAVVLEKLGRYNEAVKLYQMIITNSPNYVPARLFLGLTYIKHSKAKEAVDTLQWVVRNSTSASYRTWAQAQLDRLRLSSRTAAREIKQQPYFLGKAGVAYDSNPLLIPDNKSLSTPDSMRSAVSFLVDAIAGYPIWLKKDSRLDILYVDRNQFHDGKAQKVDFVSQGCAVDGKKRISLGKRSILFNGRYDFKSNYLAGDPFSVINRFFLSADTSIWKKTRTHFYGRFALLRYKNLGSDPSRTSRDGGRGGGGLTQYFYSKDFKTYFFIKQEVNFNQTQGDNFIRYGSLTRLGIHTPIKPLRRTVFDLSAGFDWGAYPDFSSLSSLDTAKRRDARLDIYTGITHYWMPNYATRVFYRFINSDNRNGFYDRTRHIAGVEAILSL